ncbi:class I SAM-dependent methyltransferase [bacterium]|nr:class I SAM-dependent methyltransferase [bacterium]
MPTRIRKQVQRSFLRDDKHWFAHYKPFVDSGKILKVGYGLGYVTQLVKSVNPHVVSTDIMRHPDSLDDPDVVYVDGEELPFPDRSFDVVICSMTVHHTRRPTRMMGEMVRVARKHVILIDTVARQPIAYAAMVWACYRANQHAGQFSTVLPWNYLTPRKVQRWVGQYGLVEELHHREPRECGYEAHLWVWRVSDKI